MFARNPAFRSLLLLALLAVAGCLTTRGAPGDEAEEVVITIRNDNFNQATVYTAPDYGSRRLGVVRGKSEATFRLNWHLPEIQLRMRFLAGGEILSQIWSVGSGERWIFVIPATCC